MSGVSGVSWHMRSGVVAVNCQTYARSNRSIISIPSTAGWPLLLNRMSRVDGKTCQGSAPRRIRVRSRLYVVQRRAPPADVSWKGRRVAGCFDERRYQLGAATAPHVPHSTDRLGSFLPFSGSSKRHPLVEPAFMNRCNVSQCCLPVESALCTYCYQQGTEIGAAVPSGHPAVDGMEMMERFDRA